MGQFTQRSRRTRPQVVGLDSRPTVRFKHNHTITDIVVGVRLKGERATHLQLASGATYPADRLELIPKR
jgi:hypothetical protein